MQKVVRPVAFELFTGCGGKASCASFDKKACLREGAKPISIQVTDDLFTRFCAKLDTCLGGTMQPGECATLKQDPGTVLLLEQLKIFIDPLFVCTANCLLAKDCAVLFQNGIDLLDQCAESCGAGPDWVDD